MLTVKQLLDQKGYQVWSIAPNDTVFEALKLMAEKNIGALVVIQDEKMVGILSERDYARKVILEGKSSINTPVETIMTDKVIYVEPEQSLDDCMAIMTDKHIRHLPVYEEHKLLGLISIGDVVKAVISQKEYMIEQLENYITTGR